MTNKTEDKFYFGKPGQPERFADGTESFLTIKGVRYRIVGTRKDARGNLVYDLHGTSKTAHPVPFTLVKFLDDGRWVLWGAHGGEVSRGKIEASRPGQPERFAESLQAKWDGKQYRVLTPSGAAWYSDDGKRWTLKHGETVPSSEVRKYDIKLGTGFSRPGQPDKFDASSLNRGTFAEASTSPMLGKLLSEKVMPEGGWRAVETGGGALVISFEDADLARDFGRRVATKGYNATSPVQAIGRYWNVEVKNGK